MGDTLLLALDQGTTSTRAIAFGLDLAPRAMARIELPRHYPAPGWVEHEPADLLAHSLSVLREVMAKAPGRVAGPGLTSQRETTLPWDRATGPSPPGNCLWRWW